jgi:hypothetical protein
MFDRLDFVYQPSRDAEADRDFHVATFGAEAVFSIVRFGTRVALIRLSRDGPGLLFAEHLEGDQPVLIFRVPDLEAAEATLPDDVLEERFEFPYGVGRLLVGPRRLAIYQRTHAERGRGIEGRHDF